MGPKLKNVNKKGSQKAKPKKSYLADDENFGSFSDQLRRLGLELRDVTGDGNCCFRALSDQMEGNESLHMDLRRQVCLYMRNNKDEFEPFVAALIEDEEETSNNKKAANKKLDAFEKYVKSLEQSGTYADNGCLVAFARLFQLDINIHQMDMPTWTINGSNTTKANQQVRQLHLAYHNQEHYSSIRPLGDTSHQATNFYAIPNQIAQTSKEKASKSQNTISSKPSMASSYVFYQDEYEDDDYMNDKADLASSSIGENRVLNEKIEQIIEITKCMNIDLIKLELSENGYDVDSTVSSILSQTVSDNNHDLENEQRSTMDELKTGNKPNKMTNKMTKKREKKERQMERQRTKVLEQREKELLTKSGSSKDLKQTKQSEESSEPARQQNSQNADQNALNLALMANMETKAI
jgi:OTU domain-containing protein 3